MKIDGYTHINLSYLNLMSDEDPGIRKTMLEMLIAEIPFEINRMIHLANTSSWDELREASHKMKSTLAFAGNEYMIHYNKLIEGSAKSKNNLQSIPEQLDQLLEISNDVIAELNQELSKQS